jgi:hypothetical protein
MYVVFEVNQASHREQEQTAVLFDTEDEACEYADDQHARVRRESGRREYYVVYALDEPVYESTDRPAAVEPVQVAGVMR